MLEIPDAEQYELRVCAPFADALRSNGNGRSALLPAERAWIKFYVDRAHLFIRALQQRWVTLRRIGEYLLAYQGEFLEHGPRLLKPLTRTRVAGALDFHESTVSRAVQDKIAQLPDGRLIPLRDFFDDSLAVKEAMRQVLANAHRPLSDREITECLRAEGICLARRTVTKYRAQLQHPVRQVQSRSGTAPMIPRQTARRAPAL
jgi:RNA polymerase sigma-54 factor